MKKNRIALLLAFSLIFILGCSLFTGTPTAEVPTAPEESATEEPQQSAPPTQTIEPTNTPLPEPTTPPMPQSGDLIFQTSFADISDWEVVTDSDASDYDTQIRGDGLYVEVPNDYDFWYAYAPLDDDYGNVRIEADVELVGGTNYTYITLTCRSSQDGEYIFFLDTGGYWQIGKYDWSDDDSPYEELAYGGSAEIKVAQNPNHMTVICEGSTLTMLINGHELGSVEDGHFTSGVVGIGIETFDIPLSQVMFHNLEIYIP